MQRKKRYTEFEKKEMLRKVNLYPTRALAAKAFKISQPTLYKWLAAAQSPKEDMVEKIVKINNGIQSEMHKQQADGHFCFDAFKSKLASLFKFVYKLS
jgi:hypothetical protein